MMNMRPHSFPGQVFPGHIFTGRHSGLLALMLFSMAVYAQSEVSGNGISELPPVYRKPLSAIVSEENTEWRAIPQDENPWRQDRREVLLKTTNKARLFPDYDYSRTNDPSTGNLFQNSDELERPPPNLFKYSF
jgi:hypothetical protein